MSCGNCFIIFDRVNEANKVLHIHISEATQEEKKNEAKKEIRRNKLQIENRVMIIIIIWDCWRCFHFYLMLICIHDIVEEAEGEKCKWGKLDFLESIEAKCIYGTVYGNLRCQLIRGQKNKFHPFLKLKILNRWTKDINKYSWSHIGMQVKSLT